MKKSILLLIILCNNSQNVFSFGISYRNFKAKITSWYSAVKNRSSKESKKSIDLEQYRIFSDITFDDVIGMEKEKEEFTSIIESLLQHDKTNNASKTFLLTGPTRSGKSHFFRSFVGTLQKELTENNKPINTISVFEFPIYIAKKWDLINLRTLYKKNTCIIIFIDEAHCFDHINATILADLLTDLSLLFDENPEAPVLIFFPTNKSQQLDDALKKIGKFGKEIVFDYPSIENRKKFLLKLFKTCNIDAAQFNIDEIVQQLHQQSYEMIKYLVHQSMMRTLLNDIPFKEQLQTLIDTEILKKSKNSINEN